MSFVVVVCVLCSRPLARSDGLAYFMWLDSIARDGNMNLENQARDFAHLNAYQVQWNDQTQQWTTVFPYGSALLLAPAYWISRLADQYGLLSVNAEYFISLQGRPLAYSFFPMLAVIFYAAGTAALAYLSARMFVPPLPAAAASLFLFLGTPMLYYASIEPFASHIPTAFLVTSALYLTLKWAKHPSLLLAFVIGVVSGLAILTRWQAALITLPLAALFLHKRDWRALGLFLAANILFSLHLLYTWHWMFGQPLFSRYTESGFLGSPSHIISVLFSGDSGLFAWSPLVLLALLGLVLLGYTNRVLTVIALCVFVLQVLINASVTDWWAGWGFGMRRKTELYPFFVIGMAYLLSCIRNKPIRFAMWALSSIGLIFSILLFLAHLNFINTAEPQGSTVWAELHHQFFVSNFQITWEVFREHYGPWAWHMPGP